jgi:hypothetical protein
MVTNLFNIFSNEIPMRKSSYQPKMNIWGFHVTFKNKLYTHEKFWHHSINQPINWFYDFL